MGYNHGLAEKIEKKRREKEAKIFKENNTPESIQQALKVYDDEAFLSDRHFCEHENDIYASAEKRNAVLAEYANKCVHNISGEQISVDIAALVKDLREKADWYTDPYGISKRSGICVCQ